jgi:hypothetical protein
MVSPYALLLFGGEITVQHVKGTVTVDGYIRFNAVGRIAALVRGIKAELDALLARKIEDPTVQYLLQYLL